MRLKTGFVLAALLLFLTSCNETEDTYYLMAGKKWKLSGIFESKSDNLILKSNAGETFDYQDAAFLSARYFFLDMTEGFCTAQGISKTAKGSWIADGKSRDIAFKLTSEGSESIALARVFLEAISTAQSYSAEYHKNDNTGFLKLYFDQKSKYILFRIHK